MRDAGFPQPAPAPGQFWASHSVQRGERFVSVITQVHEKGLCLFASLYSGATWRGYVDEDYLGFSFCPDAADILKELGGDLEVTFKAGAHSKSLTTSVCALPEILAKLWLKHKSKKQ